MITEAMREKMKDIQGNIGHTRVRSSTTKVLNRDGEWVEPSGPAIRNRTMFPYFSNQMGVHDPRDIPRVAEQLQKAGLFPEFDEQGRIKINSTKHCSDVAKALEMKDGAHGFGYTDEHGQFHNTGRRRADEMAEGRKKVRKAIEELNGMPEEGVPAGAIDAVLRPLGVDSPVAMGGEYDIEPTGENTGNGATLSVGGKTR